MGEYEVLNDIHSNSLLRELNIQQQAKSCICISRERYSKPIFGDLKGYGFEGQMLWAYCKAARRSMGYSLEEGKKIH